MHMDKKGFTLIEMIVVITVIGVLAAIAVPSLMAYIDKGKASDCEINRKALVLKLEAERAQSPGASMEEIIKNNPEIQCPAGGIYTAVDKDTVKCSYPGHGQDGTFHEEGETQNIEIGEIVPTLTEEENSTEDVQESSSAEGTENNEEPAGITGDRCISLGENGKKTIGVSVRSIADFVKEYHVQNPDAEHIPENAFTENVLWIYQQEDIYYYNPGNGINVTYTTNENGGYSYQIDMSGCIMLPSDFKVITADEIDNAVKDKNGPGTITLEKNSIILSKNGNLDKKIYLCIEETVIKDNSWHGEINSGKIHTMTPLEGCSP
ncbi:MAG: type II secretion system protein [Clostridium sp.]|nr:type II secretion system protein [Clostridium sp.]